MKFRLVRPRSVLAGAILGAIGLIQVSCGSGGGASVPSPAQNSPQSISVSVSPSSATVNAGATQQFSATVTGTSNTAVGWSVNGIAGGSSSEGTISASGLYTAPGSVPPGSITVTATSAADSSSSASASVKITSSESVAISPSQATLATNTTQQFTANVTGAANTAVSWSVNGVAGGNSSLGTVSSTGLYTAPAVLPSPNPVTVTATSAADPGASASASVTIAASGGSLSFLDPIVTMQGAQGLTLTVNGSGFTSASQVQFNGNPKPTTLAGATQLTAQLSADDLAQAGTFSVAVETGSSLSPALSFYVVPAFSPREVTVTAGATAPAVNVAAQAVAQSGPQILQVGLNPTADAGGATVAPGSAATLLLVGPNIGPGTYYEVSGNSDDVTVTQPLASSFISTTGGQAAVQLSITVSATAALGPRNILVTDPEGEISVFVGGLLIAPAP